MQKLPIKFIGTRKIWLVIPSIPFIPVKFILYRFLRELHFIWISGNRTSGAISLNDSLIFRVTGI